MSHVDFLAALLLFGIVARGLDLSWKNSKKKKELRLELTSLNIQTIFVRYLFDPLFGFINVKPNAMLLSENNGA